MRELIFRGKRTQDYEWVYGYLCSANSIDDGTIGIPWKVIPETVGQFTGLRDSKRTKEWPKGQMVFEGDVATGTWQVDHRTIITGIVTYYPEFGLYALKNDEGNIASVIWDSCEVIGTIHTEAK